MKIFAHFQGDLHLCLSSPLMSPGILELYVMKWNVKCYL